MESREDVLSRKVAVTGATGMLGSHLAVHLVSEGYKDITLVVRSAGRLAFMYELAEKAGVRIPEGVITVVEACLDDPKVLSEKLQGIDTVFNCAARIMSGEMTTRQLIDHNVSIACTVVDYCLEAKVRKLIHVSSISALGKPRTPDGMIDEMCEPENINRAAAYGQSKYYSEKEVWRGAKEGLEVITVLPGVILGEGEASANNSSSLIPAISSGIPIYTTSLMSFVDVRDVARAMVTLDNTSDAVGERFLLSGGDISYKELITTAAKTVHKPGPFIKIGKGMINFAYYVMQALIKMRLMKDRGVTKDNLSSILNTDRYDGSKIERFTNFRYTPVEETVVRVVKYYNKK